MIELNFYQEFHQRLNALVFQYLGEDPATVLSMLWHGFPVVTLLSVWGGLTLVWALLLRLDGRCRPRGVSQMRRSPARPPLAWHWRGATLLVLVLISVVAARGTCVRPAATLGRCLHHRLGVHQPARPEPGADPLRGGEEPLFRSSRQRLGSRAAEDEALAVTRELLDRLADPELAAVRRDYRAPEVGRLPVRNVVVILMESFAGRYVGALGSRDGITPHFDRLAGEGLLFERFANGTTHQGMFASMACFLYRGSST